MENQILKSLAQSVAAELCKLGYEAECMCGTFMHINGVIRTTREAIEILQNELDIY